MMPRFGTSIPDMAFEPLDMDTVAQVQEELNYVFNYDPRVDLIQMDVRPDYDNNTLYVNAQLLYVELGLVDNLELNIEFSS